MIGRILCRIGLHSWERTRCESGHGYPICRRCGVWLCWDGIMYERKHWPPPFPGFESLYREWQKSRGIV